MAEHSDRAKYVTEQVRIWVENDPKYRDLARHWARQSVNELAVSLTSVIRNPRVHPDVAHVHDVMSYSDFDKVHWDEIAASLLLED